MFIYSLESGYLMKFWDVIYLCYLLSFALLISVLKGRMDILKVKWQAVKDARKAIRSGEVVVFSHQTSR